MVRLPTGKSLLLQKVVPIRVLISKGDSMHEARDTCAILRLLVSEYKKSERVAMENLA